MKIECHRGWALCASIAVVSLAAGCAAEVVPEVDEPVAPGLATAGQDEFIGRLLRGEFIERDEVSEEQAGAILTALERRGVHVDPSRVDIRKNVVVVDGDTIYERDELEHAQVDKAYWAGFIPGVSPAAVGRIRLLWAGSWFAPTADMRADMRYAAAQWTNVQGSGINISESNAGPETITTYLIPGVWWDYTGCRPDAVACAPAPSGGGPGAWILFRSDECNFTQPSGVAARRKVSIHELGHTLGFAHPDEGIHIPGTAEASTGYESIMWTGCTGHPTDITLSADDRLVAQITYPAP